MMKSYGLFGFLGFIGLSVVLALPARAEDTPHVFISEINWAGSQVSTADEWIELVNLGSETVDLSHWVLTGVATNNGAIELVEGTLLQPRDTLIIANYALGDPKTTLLTAPDLVTTAISLPNSGLNILLTQPDGLVIDSYGDDGAPDFGATTPTTSIERNLESLLWQSSSESSNLSQADQLGTPDSALYPVAPAEPVVEPSVEAPPVIEPEVIETPSPTPIEPEPVIVEPVIEPIGETPTNTEIIPDVIVESEPEPTPAPAVVEAVEELCNPEISLEIPSEPVVETSNLSDEPEIVVPESITTNTPSVQTIALGELLINELVSDPADGIEWVELMNFSTTTLNLTGSSLKDAGDHTTALPEVDLAPGSYVVIENPNGNLNNSTETLTLLNHNGEILDTLTYGTTAIPAAQDGESLARTADDVWLITTPTRKAENIFPVAVAEPIITSTNTLSIEEEPIDTYDANSNESNAFIDDSGTPPGPVAETNNTQPTGAEPVHRIVAIAKSVVTKDENGVTVSKTKKTSVQSTLIGTVVALPDTFGRQILFLDGHEIYFNAANWPTLSLGDVIRVSGTPSVNNGTKRLKISSAADIAVTGHVDITPLPTDGSEFAALQHGTFVSVAGKVTGKSGNELSLLTEDDTTITIVAHKQSGVSWNAMQSGTAIISGIVRQTSDGLKLYPRSTTDVHFTPDTAPAVPTKAKTKAVSSSPLVGGGLLTGSIGALGTWYLRTKKNLFSFLPF